MNNIFSGLPLQHLPEEIMEVLAGTGQARIERIVSRGHSTPPGSWYDQADHEFVIIITGQARVRFEDPPETKEMSPGDYVIIPAHHRHRVEWTAPDRETVWLAVFYQGDPI